jgi:predicted DsbA family dithiol-disulfide isomerase
VSDRDVLTDIASATGIDPDEFVSRWRDQGAQLVQRVTEEHVDASDRGVHAVPALLVDDEFVLTGALPLDAYRRIVTRRAGLAAS